MTQKQIVKILHENLSEIGKRSLEASAAYHADTIPKHFELDEDHSLFFSELDDATKKNRARFTIVVNDKEKEVSYAISGTRVNQDSKMLRSDLYDDFLLARGRLPAKMQAIKEQNKKLIQSIKDKASEKGEDPQQSLATYKYNFTGHSLGAALSDCAATDMYLQLKAEGVEPKKMNISSVSFDNPGAKTVVQRMLKFHNKANTKNKVTLEDLRDDISYKAFNNSKNFINTMDHQVSQKYRIMKEGDKEPKASSLMFGYLKNILKRVPIIRTVVFLCSLGSISKQIKSHSLDNFVDVFTGKNKEGDIVQGKVKHKGVILSVEDVALDREPIKYDKKVFNHLSKFTKDNVGGQGQEQAYVMVDPKDPEKKFVVSQLQIQNAYEAAYQPEIQRQNSKDSKGSKLTKNLTSKFTKKKTKMSLFTAKDLYEGREPGGVSAAHISRR